MAAPDPERTLPVDDAARLAALAASFVQSWRAGSDPRLDDFLGQVEESLRGQAFRELLKAEVKLRRRRRERVAASDYLEHFPQFEAAVREICPEVDNAKETVERVAHIPHAGFQVRCPHCHNPVELVPDGLLESIRCTVCGSDFSLTTDEDEATRDARQLANVGHFKLVERLGIGAFGTVWKAQDTELDRTVALKIPRTANLDKYRQDLFLREARSAAQLRHPNIVSVYEAGRDGDTLYIVSELVRGITLADRLTAGPMSALEAAELCAKIAAALHHAHEHGVIHRDLKPANVMLDNVGEPHLMDFGLARREAHEVTMTLDGQVLGTPAYMSPEQAQGEAHAADRRSDVYSLGVMLFEMLTGELPFRGNSRMMLHQVINEEPPKPRKLNANVSRDLETITLKCLEKAPGRRFQTADELSQELRHYLKGEPIKARPTTGVERSWRWCKRNRAVASLMALVVIATVAGFAGVTWQWRDAVLSRNREIAARNRAESSEVQAHRAALTGYGAAADALFHQIRAMRSWNTTQSQRKAISLLSEASGLWKRADDSMKDLLARGISLVDDRAAWEARVQNLRLEAVRWTTESKVWRVGEVAIPTSSSESPAPYGAQPYDKPFLGSTADGERFAVFLPQSEELVLLSRDGALLHRRRLSEMTGSNTNSPRSRREPTAMAFSPGLTRLAVLNAQAPPKIALYSIEGTESQSLSLPKDSSFDDVVSAKVRLAFSDDDEIVLQRGSFWRRLHKESTADAPAAPWEQVPSIYLKWKYVDGEWVLAADRPPSGPDASKAVRSSVPLTDGWITYWYEQWDVRTSKISRLDAFHGTYACVHDDEIMVSVNGKPPGLRGVLKLSARERDNGDAVQMHFSADAKYLAAATGLRAIIIDVANGLHADMLWSAPNDDRYGGRNRNRIYVQGQEFLQVEDIVPFQSGFVSLEHPQSQDRFGGQSSTQWRLGVWEVSLPQSRVAQVNETVAGQTATDQVFNPYQAAREQPIHVLQTSDDGAIVAAHAFGPAKWKWDATAWSSSARTAEWEADFCGNFLVASSWSTADNWNTALYSTATGQQVRAFPASKTDHVRAISTDAALAVIAEEDVEAQGSEPGQGGPQEITLPDNGEGPAARETLFLVSLAENRRLLKLGRFYKTVDDEYAPISIEFSPDRQWLVISQNSVFGVWNLAKTQFVGQVNVDPSYQQIDWSLAPGWALLVDAWNAGVLVNLDEPRVLLNVDHPGGFSSRSIAHGVDPDNFVRIEWIEGDEPSAGGLYVTTWSLKTGQRNKWKLSSGIVLQGYSDETMHAMLNRNDSRLLIYGPSDDSSKSLRVELWDLQEQKLIRDATLANAAGDVVYAGLHYISFADANTVSLTCRADRSTASQLSGHLCWNWSDGANVPNRGPLLVAGTNWAIELADNRTVLRRRTPPSAVNMDAQLSMEASGESSELTSLLSPDERVIALRFPNQAAGLFEIATGRRICDFPEHHVVRAFDFTGHWCATIGDDRELIIWDTVTGATAWRSTLPWPIGGKGFQDLQLKVDATGKRVAFWTHGSLALWDVEDSRLVQKLEPLGHFRGTSSLGVHASKDLIATGGYGGDILLWKGDSGAVVRNIWADDEPISQLTVSPDESTLAYSNASGVITLLTIAGERIWRFDPELSTRTGSGPRPGYYDRLKTAPIFALRFHPTGKFLAAAALDGQVLFIDVTSGERIAAIGVDGTPITSLDFSPDGTAIAMGSQGGRAYLWRMSEQAAPQGHHAGSAVTDVAFMGRADLLATAGDAIHFWDTHLWTELLTFGEQGLISDIEFADRFRNFYVVGEHDFKVYDLKALQDRLDNLGLSLESRLPTEPVALSPESGPAWISKLRELNERQAVSSADALHDQTAPNAELVVGSEGHAGGDNAVNSDQSLADSLLARRQFPQAEAEYRRLLALAQDVQDAEALLGARYGLAMCLLRQGKSAEGVEILQELLKQKLERLDTPDALELREAWKDYSNPDLSAKGIEGQDGLDFDGDRDYVLIPSLQFDGRPPWTLEVIIKPVGINQYDVEGQPSWTSLVSAADGGSISLGTNGRKWSIDLYVAEEHGDRWTENYASALTRKDVQLNTWQHVAGVWDGHELRLYLNGKLQDTRVGVEYCALLSEGPFFLGADPDDLSNEEVAQGYFHGRMRAARIARGEEYTGSFDAPERLEQTPHTIALYDFSTDAGRIAVDRSGHGHHGIIVGAKYVKDSE